MLWSRSSNHVLIPELSCKLVVDHHFPRKGFNCLSALITISGWQGCSWKATPLVVNSLSFCCRLRNHDAREGLCILRRTACPWNALLLALQGLRSPGCCCCWRCISRCIRWSYSGTRACHDRIDGIADFRACNARWKTRVPHATRHKRCHECGAAARFWGN